MAPIMCSRILNTRKFFECKSESNKFFRIHTNGFFHLIEPIRYDSENNLAWFDVVIIQILDMFIYSIKVMKLAEMNAEQSIYIILRNITNFEWTRASSILREGGYKFCSDTPDVEFFYQVNPTDDWPEIRNTFDKMFRDFLTELGLIDFKDITINRWLYEILEETDIHHEHRGTDVIMPRIGLENFGFTEEEKK